MAKSVLVKSNERPNNRLECPICKERFWLRCKYNEHIANHPQFSLSCNICSKGFNDQKLLDEHYLTHTSVIKTYDCTHCDRKFLQKYQLEQHEQFHTHSFLESIGKNRKSVTFKKICDVQSLPTDFETSESEEFIDENEGDDDIDEDISDIEDYLPANKVIVSRSGRTIKRKKIFDEEYVDFASKSPRKQSPKKESTHNRILKSPKRELPPTEKVISPKKELSLTEKSTPLKKKLFGKSKSPKMKQMRVRKSTVSKCESQVKDSLKDLNIDGVQKEIMSKKLSVVIEKLSDHIYQKCVKEGKIHIDNLINSNINLPAVSHDTNNNSYKVKPKQNLKNVQKPSQTKNTGKLDANVSEKDKSKQLVLNNVEDIPNAPVDNNSLSASVSTAPKRSRKSRSKASKNLDNENTSVAATPLRSKSPRPSNVLTPYTSPTNKQYMYIGNKPDIRKIQQVVDKVSTMSSKKVSDTNNNSRKKVKTVSQNKNVLNTPNSDASPKSNVPLSNNVSPALVPYANSSPKDTVPVTPQNLMNNKNIQNSLEDILANEEGIIDKTVVGEYIVVKVTPEYMERMQKNPPKMQSSTKVAPISSPVSSLNKNLASSPKKQETIENQKSKVVVVTPPLMTETAVGLASDLNKNYVSTPQRLLQTIENQKSKVIASSQSPATTAVSNLNKNLFSPSKNQEAIVNQTKSVAGSSFPVNVIHKIQIPQNSFEVPITDNSLEHSQALPVQCPLSPKKKLIDPSSATFNKKSSIGKQKNMQQTTTLTGTPDQQEKIRESEELNVVPTIGTNAVNNITKTTEIQTVSSLSNSLKSQTVSHSKESLAIPAGKQKTIKNSKTSGLTIEVNNLENVRQPYQTNPTNSLTVYSCMSPKSPIIQSKTISLVHSKIPDIRTPPNSVLRSKPPISETPTLSIVGSKIPKIQSSTVSVIHAKSPSIQNPIVSVAPSKSPKMQTATVAVTRSKSPKVQRETVSVAPSKSPKMQSATVLHSKIPKSESSIVSVVHSEKQLANPSPTSLNIMNRSYSVVDGKKTPIKKRQSSVANAHLDSGLQVKKDKSSKTYEKSISTPNKNLDEVPAVNEVVAIQDTAESFKNKQISPQTNQNIAISSIKKQLIEESKKFTAAVNSVSDDVDEINTMKNITEEILVTQNEHVQMSVQSPLKEPQTKSTTLGLYDFMNQSDVNNMKKSHEEIPVIQNENEAILTQSPLKQPQMKNSVTSLFDYMNQTSVNKINNMKNNHEEISVIHNENKECKQTLEQSPLKKSQPNVGLYDYMNQSDISKNNSMKNSSEEILLINDAKDESEAKQRQAKNVTIGLFDYMDLSDVNKSNNMGKDSKEILDINDESEQTLAPNVFKEPQVKDTAGGLFDYMDLNKKNNDKLLEIISPVYKKKKRNSAVSGDENRSAGKKIIKKVKKISTAGNLSSDVNKNSNNSYEEIPVIPSEENDSKQILTQSILKGTPTKNTAMGLFDYMERKTPSNNKLLKNKSIDNLAEVASPIHDKKVIIVSPTSKRELSIADYQKEKKVRKRRKVTAINDSLELNNINGKLHKNKSALSSTKNASPITRRRKKLSVQNNKDLTIVDDKKEKIGDKDIIIDDSFEFKNFNNLEACPQLAAEETVVTLDETNANSQKKKRGRKTKTKSVEKEAIETSRANGIKRKGRPKKSVLAAYSKEKRNSLKNKHSPSQTPPSVTIGTPSSIIQKVPGKRGRPKKQKTVRFHPDSSEQKNSSMKQFHEKLLQRYKAKLEEKEQKKKEKYEFKKKMKYIERLLASPARDSDAETFNPNIPPTGKYYSDMEINIDDVIKVTKKCITVKNENAHDTISEEKSHLESSKQDQKSNLGSSEHCGNINDSLTGSKTDEMKSVEAAIKKVELISLKFNKDLDENEYLKLLDEIDELIVTNNIANKCSFLTKPIRFLSYYVESYKVRQKAISLGVKLRNAKSS